MACCTEPLLRAVRQIHAVDSFEMLVVLPAASANGVDKWGKRKSVSGCTIMRTNCGSIDSSNGIRLISGAACLTL
jgi:hypothetical protein